MTTTVEENKALTRRFIEEIFVGGNLAAVDELLADDFVPHTWPSTGPGNGKADLKAAIARLAVALSDVAFAIADMVGEDDRVAVRLTATGRQVGEFMKLPASGQTYTISEMHIFRFRDGLLVEHWHQFDQLGMLRQLGALPAAAA